MRDDADQVSSDFLFSGEGQQDWLMQYFPVAETGVKPVPICQYIDPRCRMLSGVSGFDDREMLNQILLYHYVIQYEPYYYKGRLADFPLTLAYGQKIDALRRKYRPEHVLPAIYGVRGVADITTVESYAAGV